MTTKMQRSSGNVFRDLGFSAEEATNLKMRSDLMIRLSKLIAARGLTQAQAADLFGVTQPRVSDLVRGKIDRFSVDTLIAMLGHAGVRVQIVLGPYFESCLTCQMSRTRGRARASRASRLHLECMPAVSWGSAFRQSPGAAEARG